MKKLRSRYQRDSAVGAVVHRNVDVRIALLGLTVEGVAGAVAKRMARTGRSYYYSMFKRRGGLTDKELSALASALGCEVSNLLKEENHGKK